MAIVPLAQEVSFDISFVNSRFEPLSAGVKKLMSVLHEPAAKSGPLIDGADAFWA